MLYGIRLHFNNFDATLSPAGKTVVKAIKNYLHHLTNNS